MTAEQRRKSNCRAYTHTYVKRGKLKKEPCFLCGKPNVQAHHSDYSKPLKVTWLCRYHHIKHHATERANDRH